MKYIKDILLERRIKELKIEGKKIPQMYIDVFNDYIEEISESLTDHDKQVRKKVVQEIREKLKLKEIYHPEDDFEIDYDFYYKEDVEEVLNQIQEDRQ